jgi:hypothetical protein
VPDATAMMVVSVGHFAFGGTMRQESIQPPTSKKHLLEEIPKTRERSLEGRSHTLANIIKSARMIIVAPLVAGAYQIPTLISTGQYWAAIQCALVAGLSFLVLTFSLGLADVAAHTLEKWRK